MIDPHTRALAALEQLYAPDMDAVLLSAWQEVQDALSEAQSQHRALMEQMSARRDRTAILGRPAAEEDVSFSEDAARTETPKGVAGADLLEALQLAPDDPLPL